MKRTPDPAVCEDVRRQLPAYQSGDLSPLQRQRLRRHLQACADCAAEWALLEGITRAAKTHTEVPSLNQKQRMLAAVQKEILATPPPQRPSVPPWTRWFAATLTAAAAAGIGLWFFAPLGVPAPKIIELPDLPPGLKVVGLDTHGLTAQGEQGAPHLEFTRGTVFVRFKRAPDGAPLWVTTPHARVEVQGTAFSVRTNATQTEVMVERGRVRVHPVKGAPVPVDAGAAVTVAGPEVARRVAEAPWTAELQQRLSITPHVSRPIPLLSTTPSLEPAARPPTAGSAPKATQVRPPEATRLRRSSSLRRARPTPAPSPSRSIATPARPRPAQPTAPKEPDPTAEALKRVAEAVRALRAGELERSLALLQDLNLETLPPRARDEGLYTRASAQRGLGHYRDAVRTLERLSGVSNREPGQLALLERARILRHHLNAPAAANQPIEALLRRPHVVDWISQEAWFEKCSLAVALDDLPLAERCTAEMLSRFPDTLHRSALKKLTQRRRTPRP